MEKSEQINELAAALGKFQAAVPQIKKDGVNPFFKSKYATLENIIATTKAELAKNGLSFTQLPTGDNELSTTLFHSSGQFITASAKITPKDDSPQGQGSAITYMRRYALSAVLGIASEEDDDGNAASQPARPKAVARPLAKPGMTIREPNAPATKLQVDKIFVLLPKAGKTKEQLEAKFGPVENLTKGIASGIIEALMKKADEVAKDGVPSVSHDGGDEILPPEEEIPFGDI